MTDTIFIKGVLIHARHGVMEHESEVGQRFVIDLELYTDLSDSSRSDRLADTVSYSEVVVPPGSFFVLGDHRNLSRDSRDFGPVEASYIYGKAVFGYWPVDKVGRLR